ncbi:MAG: PKD domain-containing protein [Saprospiraceae bacterium]
MSNFLYVQCSGFSRQFNLSAADAAAWQWHFGDPAQPNATATGASVSHTYSQPGCTKLSLPCRVFAVC